MLLAYFTANYVTIMILSAVIVTMLINRRYEIPASDLFFLGVALLLVITVFDTVSDMCRDGAPYFELSLSGRIRLREISSAIAYILRPFVIMIEVLVIMPPSKSKPLVAIPAALNLVIYSTAFMDSSIAFTITDDNSFFRGPLGYSVFVSQLFYVLVLIVISLHYFSIDSGRGRNAMVFLILAQTVLTIIFELTNKLPGYANIITALAILEYYIYLSIIHQQDMEDAITQRDIELEKEKLLLLRHQIHPHFIYNSLSIIRSLAKRDSTRAVSCIDTFSDYLKAHIRAIEHEDLVPFDTELKNVRAYLDLVKADKTRTLEVNYDLKATDFYIPPLSLEPIVENAVNHGVSKYNGVINISSEAAEDCYVITITDNGSANNTLVNNTPFHNGVGLDNTRRRLDLLCSGTLEINIKSGGTVAKVLIPKKEGFSSNEGTDS